MRVLHFYSTYHPDTFGGAEQAIYQICESVSTKGIHSTVLAVSRTSSSEPISLSRHTVIQSQLSFELASTRFSWAAMKQFAKLARSYDLVHFHFPWPFADLCQLLSRSKTPYVVTYHSDIVKQASLAKLYAPLMHQFLRAAKAVVATSEEYAKSSLVLQKYSSKTHVIPLGLDPASFAKPSIDALEKWRKELPPRYFLFVGVLRYYKGLHLLIEAVRGTTFDVVIAGSGPLEDELKAQAVGLKNVRFLGEISEEDKSVLLQSAFGYAFPSHMRSEAFGMSLLEASAFGLPMITLEIDTGSSFINLAGITGLTVSKAQQGTQATTISALTLALSTLWNSPKLALEMGELAKQRFDSHFRAELMGEKYANLYRTIVPGVLSA
jgi:O-antigen biosynthesis rhamnosyltransferase